MARVLYIVLVSVLASVFAGCALLRPDLVPQGTYTVVDDHGEPLRLFAQEQGAGQPILLLHGFGANTNTWRRILPDLAKRHRVVALDLKGFGDSDKPFDRRYSALDQAELVAQFLDRRDMAGITLIGHSFGGAVALALTLKLNRIQPNRIRRLILIDTPAYPQQLPLLFKVLRTPLVAHIGVAVAPPEILAKSALAASYDIASPIALRDVLAYARPLYEFGGKYAILRTAAQIIPPELDDLIARYPTIHQPTLLVWCRRDPLVPLSTGQQLKRALPNARLKVLEKCGHVPQEEQPTATVQAMRAFLGEQ